GVNVGIDGVTGSPMPTTGADGKVTRDVPATTLRYHAQKDGFGPKPTGSALFQNNAEVEGSVAVGAGDSKTVTLVLMRGVATLTFEVNSPVGTAIEGANIGIDGVTGSPMPKTAADGKLTREVPAGTIRYHAQKDGFGPKPAGGASFQVNAEVADSVTLAPGETKTVKLELTRNAAQLTVEVKTPEGKAIEGANVGIDGVTGSPMPKSGADGKYTSEVPLGTLRIHAQKDKYGPKPTGSAALQPGAEVVDSVTLAEGE